jgi:hypothetical protein
LSNLPAHIENHVYFLGLSNLPVHIDETRDTSMKSCLFPWLIYCASR